MNKGGDFVTNILEITNLNKIYGKGDNKVQALKDITLSIEKGKFTAIIGPSGSGKSTLLNCIAGLDTVSSGKVMLKGKDISTLRGKEIDPPPTLARMIEFGTEVAKLYKYARVDFYDVDGVLYFGEITQCHGGGFDQMRPFEYDIKFGHKITLPI